MSGNKCYGLTPTQTYSPDQAILACSNYQSTSMVSESFACSQRGFIWVNTRFSFNGHSVCQSGKRGNFFSWARSRINCTTEIYAMRLKMLLMLPHLSHRIYFICLHFCCQKIPNAVDNVCDKNVLSYIFRPQPLPYLLFGPA